MNKALLTSGARDMWQVHYQLAAIHEALNDFLIALRHIDVAFKSCYHDAIVKKKYEIEQKLLKTNILGASSALHGHVEVIPQYWEEPKIWSEVRADTLAGAT